MSTLYRVIESPNLRLLQAQVNTLLSSGWRLQCGIAFSITAQSGGLLQRSYAQALTREQESELMVDGTDSSTVD